MFSGNFIFLQSILWGVIMFIVPDNIKYKVEDRLGQQIRYAQDAEALAIDIKLKLEKHISASTIKRLFGIVKSYKNPRIYTLDLIAIYAGYKNWEAATVTLDISIVEKIPQNNIAGNPADYFEIKYLGDNIFVMLSNLQKDLEIGQVLLVLVINKNNLPN